MSGHKPFKGLSDKLRSTPEGRAQVDSQRRLTEAIVELTKLREARGVTQQQIADAWEVTQANISKVEHTPDIFLSTLGKYVEALGGRLEIQAVFPDQVICLLPAGAARRGKPGASDRERQAVPADH
jgi:transcriptional regulator with XRE-family HTH domain